MVKQSTNISEGFLKKVLADQLKEIKRHMSVLGEEYQDRIKIVTEQVVSNSEKLTVIESRLDGVGCKLSGIQIQLDSIQNELCRKVGYEEFQSLSNRVSKLEGKLSNI